jgi:hypothetical protein
MPLDQHIEGGHGERQPGMEILLYTVHDFPVKLNKYTKTATRNLSAFVDGCS